MKTRKWRTYYGYRPQSLAELGKLTDKQIDAQAAAYVSWLMSTRKWSKTKAKNYAQSQSTAELISATETRESTARQEEYLGDRRSIRTVRSWSGGKHYGNVRFSGAPVMDWHRVHRGEGVTTYSVMLDGRCVNSFLTKARAKEWALAKLQQVA